MSKTAATPELGPYAHTSTTTYKVAPIEITIVKDTKSSHVPLPCACHDEDDEVEKMDVMAVLAKMAQLLAAMQAQQAAQSSSGPTDPTAS